MTIEIKSPILPESVTEASIATWHKKPGEFAKQDELLADIETDKVVLEVVAPEDGILESIKKKEGESVKGQELIATFKPGSKEEASQKTEASDKSETSDKSDKKESASKEAAPKEAAPKEVRTEKKKTVEATNAAKPTEKPEHEETEALSPSLRRLMSEENISFEQIKTYASGKQITKELILEAAKQTAKTHKSEPEKKQKSEAETETDAKTEKESGNRVEKRVPMSKIRAKIAERLVESQHTAAILATFNEINMQPIMMLRQKYKETFEKEHGTRLGFMSFFTLAVVEALKHFPIINASVEGKDIIYHGYYDIGIAISMPRGLVVPVLRNAESLSMSEIEKQIADYSEKAKTNKLTLEDMTGGTFTLSNGGVFGSLMSTPIINPPQSAILGMHKILERPVVENGQIVIRPMMYVALSYDHRIIDGADSVRFLVMVKELLEEPARLALGI